ncbi:transcriptional regulator, partial [Enterobacter kobei]|nr:transcriptional regulator [Enterobacter kobei]
VQRLIAGEPAEQLQVLWQPDFLEGNTLHPAG